MKNKKIYFLCTLLTAILISAALPPKISQATGQQETGEEEQLSEESSEETEHPESYYLPVESNAIEGWPAGPQVEGEAAVVMDAGTGAFLYSKNMEAKEYPASITKIMTTLVAIENGDLDSRVKFSEWAVNSLEEGSSRLWMDVGERLTLRQALYGIMLESANDCANAVAEKIGGSEEGFAELMNKKAKELGCVNTHFVNAHGLHNENHYTCARDMAIITKAAMENEIFAEIAKTIEYIIPKSKHVKQEHVLVNHQKMLYKDGFYYKGCQGGKTGFTEAAWNTLVTVAQRKERQLICVILRTNGPDKICWETKELLDYGYKNFVRKTIPITDGEMTRAELLEDIIFGKASVMRAPALSEPMMIVESSAEVSLPKGSDVSEVARGFRGGKEFFYTYHGWQVSSVPVKFNTVDVEIPDWQLINTDLSANLQMTEKETEALSFPEKTRKVLKAGTGKVIDAWKSAWEWIYDHDIAAALAGLILIILMLPMLIIAYIRNRSSQRIRKQRQREREERIKIERDIDSKSAIEIEEELRAELEKERLRQEEASRKCEESSEKKEKKEE